MARKILLADDSVTAQNMGRKILSEAGYEVLTVNNGSAALKKVAEHKPDLIVLDVYMPGYSGLEVCQRLKENRDTARIPILLTVGKLEPFKPDEARRVKADAYVVKPFEASELLTALTRLEDKIVPQAKAEPEKPGRFAKAIAEFESGEKFGDAESGWKNRLRFPTGEKKPEAEAEPEIPSSSAQRAALPDEPSQSGFERQIPAGLPADITPEEIAAITAAAAQLSGKTEATQPEPAAAVPAVIEEPVASQTEAAVVAVDSKVEASAQVAESAAAQPSAEEEAAPVTLAAAQESVSADEQVSAEAAPVEAVASSQEASPVEAAAEATAEVQSPAAEAQPDEKPPASADADVMAALESLGPSNGNGSAHLVAASSQATDGIASPSVLAEVAKMEIAQAAGPRWIAEPVAVDVDESAASLESEMHKAFAAFAAADAARAAFPATAALAGMNVVPPRAETSQSVIAELESNASTLVEAASAAPVETTASAPDHASSAEPSPVISSDAAAKEESDDKDPHADALRAAVWANWNQIRDSIVGATSSAPQAPAEQTSAPAVASAETTGEKDTREKADDSEAMAAAASAGSTPTAAAEAGTIANIVESVLAELRPKIVEEITRKLGKEKSK